MSNEENNSKIRGTEPKMNQNESTVKGDSVQKGSKPIENHENNINQNVNELDNISQNNGMGM